jgi:deoxyribonuclease-4
VRVGAHESIAESPALAFERGAKDGCEAIQIFTRSGRSWAAPPIAKETARDFRAAASASGMGPVAAHNSYLVNIAAADAALRRKSVRALHDEIQRCGVLGVPYLVMHPGAHADEKKGIALVARGLSECLRATRGSGVMVLLENTAGQGVALGWRFEQIAEMIARCSEPERLGVCLDTQHAFAAGWDWRTPAGYARLFDEFERTLGLSRLRAFHLNDSKRESGARVDRHEEIGRGRIGKDAFRRLVNDARFAGVPGYLETPSPERYRATLRMLKKMRS